MRYIDADRLRKDILGLPNCYNGFSDTYDKALIIDRIDEQPTADVRENVRGEWIEDNPRDKSMMWRCSVCGRIAYYPTIGERKSYKKHYGYNFCPNCGADMRIPVEIARSIVHKAIDNSVWADFVDTAKMHKVVDDKYAEITERGQKNERLNQQTGGD